MDILISINGTHSEHWHMPAGDYDVVFAGTHVDVIHQISDRIPTLQKLYLRGPSAFGVGVTSTLISAVNFIIEMVQKSEKLRNGPVNVYMSGYSRGAAICLEVANIFLDETALRGIFSDDKPISLDRSRIRAVSGKVKFKQLIFFDAVDMSAALSAKTIPDNVESTIHAVRSKVWGSRLDWGNVGLEHATSCRTGDWMRVFNATHAALGGLPTLGDLPRPMVHELLASKRIDWPYVEGRFEKKPPNTEDLKLLSQTPGIYLNADTKCFLTFPGKRAKDIGAEPIYQLARPPSPEPKFSVQEMRQQILQPPAFGSKPTRHGLAVGNDGRVSVVAETFAPQLHQGTGKEKPIPAWQLAKIGQPPPAFTRFRDRLNKYIGTGPSSPWATLATKNLPSLNLMQYYFYDIPVAEEIIHRYVQEDRTASDRVLAWVRRGLVGALKT